MGLASRTTSSPWTMWVRERCWLGRVCLAELRKLGLPLPGVTRGQSAKVVLIAALVRGKPTSPLFRSWRRGVDGGDMGACGEQGSGRGGWVRGGLAQHTEPHSDAGCFGHGLLPVVAHEIDRGRSDDPFGQEQTVGRAPARVGDLFKQARADLCNQSLLPSEPVGDLKADSFSDGAISEV